MARTRTRIVAVLAAALSLFGATMATAGSAGAAPASATAPAVPVIPLNLSLDASTTIAKLGITVNVTGGNLNGQLDLGTGALTGTLTLPPASSSFAFAGFNLATATFAISQAGPLTGNVNLAAGTATITTSFNIRIPSVKVFGFLNIVRSTCTTAQPVTVTLSGPISLTGPTTFTGTYTIPPFKDCGLLITPLLTALISGPGNTFTGTGSPPAL